MIELKGLEDWARQILATSITTLNRRYGTWKRSDEFQKSIEALPFYTRYRSTFRQISEPTLLELHQKLRGQKCENNFWDAVLMHLDHPLPDEIALDLIARFGAESQLVLMLGHTRQSDEVMWKLAPLVDEALLTLAKSFYAYPNHTVDEFEEVLRRFPTHEWMLDSLSHCPASSVEKRRAFEKIIENHPRRDMMLATNPIIEPNQSRSSYFDLGHLSQSEQLSALYGLYASVFLIDIARDDATPDEILHELEKLQNIPYVSEIRIAARHNLRRREELESDLSL